MTWLDTPEVASDAPAPSSFEAVFELRPELHQRYREFESLFWRRRLVDPVLLELCRLRVAQLLGCESELRVRHREAQNDGLSEDKIEALESGAGSDAFSKRESDCLAFAEGFVRDPHSITDAQTAAVVSHLGEKGTVALAEALALFDGFARFRNLLGVEPSDGIEIVEAQLVNLETDSR